MTAMARHWEERLVQGGDAARARLAQRFFRTGKGEYGEGDRFLGYTVPEVRRFVRQALDLTRDDLRALLRSPWHEVRQLAILVLTKQAQRLKTDERRNELAQWVLAHRAGFNNWDLIDVSMPTLIGGVAPTKTWRRTIKQLFASTRLWDRRIALLTTFGWMRQGALDPVWEYAALCLDDREDLIQKAAGWMLREAGKRDLDGLRTFLEEYRLRMPRTMLRYAIERFPKLERQRYLVRTSFHKKNG